MYCVSTQCYKGLRRAQPLRRSFAALAKMSVSDPLDLTSQFSEEERMIMVRAADWLAVRRVTAPFSLCVRLSLTSLSLSPFL